MLGVRITSLLSGMDITPPLHTGVTRARPVNLFILHVVFFRYEHLAGHKRDGAIL
jgi:hypothetical protein